MYNGFKKLISCENLFTQNFKEAVIQISENAKLAGYIQYKLADRKAIVARVN